MFVVTVVCSTFGNGPRNGGDSIFQRFGPKGSAAKSVDLLDFGNTLLQIQPGDQFIFPGSSKIFISSMGEAAAARVR
jgi:hypothetical protein